MSGYRNKFEERCAKLIPASFAYEATKLPYTINHTYMPDWIDVANQHIIEAKGRFDASERRKLKAIRQAYPTYTIEVWFWDLNQPISKGSKTTNAKWCNANGIIAKQGPRT